MPDMSAVKVLPTWAVPLMVGTPVAGLLVGSGTLSQFPKSPPVGLTRRCSDHFDEPIELLARTRK